MSENWRGRCDWCDWPLSPDGASGCTAVNCSQRPLAPLTPTGEARQACRVLEQQLTASSSRIAELEAELKRAREALESAQAALGDNALSQSEGGKGIAIEYYHAINRKINAALSSEKPDAS